MRINRSGKRLKVVVIIGLVLLILVLVSIALWVDHVRQLRADMESYLESAVAHIEQGYCYLTQVEAEAALDLARRLSDDESIGYLSEIIRFTDIVLNSNELFADGFYRLALDGYVMAAQIASRFDDIDTGFLADKIVRTENFITFFNLIEYAESLTEAADYEFALSVYEQARSAAAALSFADGVAMAEDGIAYVHERIISVKRALAEEYLSQGELYYREEKFVIAVIYFRSSLELYVEIDDAEGIRLATSRVEETESKLAEIALYEPPDEDDTTDNSLEETLDDDALDQPGEPGGPLTNYEHNLSIYFNMSTLIDDQNRRPANQVRMGSVEGMNEGWYNGCGWVATYNALILLGDPVHPAEIVNYFETSGGAAFGGMFGTYPKAIEAYLRDLGFDVNHTLFPRTSTGIDDAIRASRVAIIAYAHTSAAHYVTIEYRDDIGKFVIYNDSSARAMSVSLGFQNETNVGAAVDSVAAFLRGSPEILFPFSLITMDFIT